MNWLYGLVIGFVVVVPMFVLVCREDKLADEEDDKTLLGALD